MICNADCLWKMLGDQFVICEGAVIFQQHIVLAAVCATAQSLFMLVRFTDILQMSHCKEFLTEELIHHETFTLF